MLGMLFKVQQAISHSPSISSHLPKELSTPPTNILHLVGAGAELSIFPAQKDHSPVLWNIENPPPLSSANPNLPCSPAPPTHRQFLSLFSRQAPTVSRAEASPALVSPQPCTMSLHSWEWRVLCALLLGLLLGLLPPSARAGSWLGQARE